VGLTTGLRSGLAHVARRREQGIGPPDMALPDTIGQRSDVLAQAPLEQRQGGAIRPSGWTGVHHRPTTNALANRGAERRNGEPICLCCRCSG